jgi:hypothetical protein
MRGGEGGKGAGGGLRCTVRTISPGGFCLWVSGVSASLVFEEGTGTAYWRF